jgi:hypothetical protein
MSQVAHAHFFESQTFYMMFSAVAHDACWLDLAANADDVVEARMLSEALANIKLVSVDEARSRCIP